MVSLNKSYFGEEYFIIYTNQLSSEETERQTGAIERMLSLRKRSVLLDLGCGWGRHSIEFAKRDYRVFGLDNSKLLIQLALKRQEGEGTYNAEFVLGNMVIMPFKDSQFDAVISLFTSFGYFIDQDNLRVLREIERILKPNGHLLLDVMNRDEYLRLPNNSWREQNGNKILDVFNDDNALLNFCKKYKDKHFIILESLEYDSLMARIHRKRIILDENWSNRRVCQYSLRLYTFQEIKEMLLNAGLYIDSVYGDLVMSKYTVDSERMIVVSRKPVVTSKEL